MMYLQVMRTKFDQFGGRAGRREFWLFALVHVILSIIAGVLDMLIFDLDPYETGAIYGIYAMLSFVPLIALGSRRLHDSGRSGWWQVLMVCWIPAVILGILAAAWAEFGDSDTETAIFGTLALIFLIAAVVGSVILLVFALLPGEQDDNDYGSPGESPDRPAVFWTVVGSRYAQFTGRAGRTEYWLFALVNAILTAIAAGLGEWLFVDLQANPISLIYLLVIIVPALALGARRLHDIGRTGWWQLLILLPVIGWVVLLVFAIMPSHEEENSHGPLPETPA